MGRVRPGAVRLQWGGPASASVYPHPGLKVRPVQSVKQLYDLQELDLKLAAAEKSLADVRARLADDSALTSAGEMVDRLRTRADEVGSRRRAVERSMEELGERRQAVESKLYGGEITNPKGLSAAEEEREFMLSQLREVEDKLLELMVETDDIQLERGRAEETLERLQAERPVEEAGLLETEQRLTGELDSLGKSREKIAPSVSPDLLSLYDSLRKTKGGRAVARVERGMCQGCRISLPTMELQRARSAQRVTRCGSCQRIIYVV